MSAPALTKQLLEDLFEASVVSFSVSLEGGSDEAYTEINLTHDPSCYRNRNEESSDAAIKAKIEDWILEALDYSGAGDGSDYGDDYEYDLENMKVSHEEWYMERRTKKDRKTSITVENNERSE